MDKRIKALIEGYEAAFSALDAKKQGELFADEFIAAGPKGVISQGKATFVANAEKAGAFYRKVGQQKAEIKAMKETWFSDNYAMVTVHWAVTFKSADKPVEFDVSYLVQATDDDPKVILFITHSSEEEAMKQLEGAKAA